MYSNQIKQVQSVTFMVVYTCFVTKEHLRGPGGGERLVAYGQRVSVLGEGRLERGRHHGQVLRAQVLLVLNGVLHAHTRLTKGKIQQRNLHCVLCLLSWLLYSYIMV